MRATIPRLQKSGLNTRWQQRRPGSSVFFVVFVFAAAAAVYIFAGQV